MLWWPFHWTPANLDKVYELASSNTPYPATIVQVQTVEALADELQASLVLLWLYN